MPRPPRREVESCYQFLERLVRQSEDHEYRNDTLDESETKLLVRRMRTALAVVRRDREPELHDWIIDMLQWVHEGRKLTFRQLGRKAGLIADEVSQVLRHEYGGGDESAARKQAPRRAVTLPIKPQPPASGAR
jgi:hypothetical protein